MDKPTTPSIREQLSEILDKYFPDGMDTGMYHPNLSTAADQIISLIVKEAEGMRVKQEKMGVNAVILPWQDDPEMFFRNQALDDFIKRVRGK